MKSGYQQYTVVFLSFFVFHFRYINILQNRQSWYIISSRNSVQIHSLTLSIYLLQKILLKIVLCYTNRNYYFTQLQNKCIFETHLVLNVQLIKKIKPQPFTSLTGLDSTINKIYPFSLISGTLQTHTKINIKSCKYMHSEIRQNSSLFLNNPYGQYTKQNKCQQWWLPYNQEWCSWWHPSE